MCGIVGIAGRHDPDLVQRMANAIVHRGPDGAGFHNAPEARICMGMRRLAIIDLETGDQPLHSADGKVHLVYNGEIYNHREVRAELEALGHGFHTHSDTEVVLEAYLAWGGEAWSRLHGMFALAIIDERGRKPKLLLVRDRPGIKPLYLARQGDKLLFASEIKALQADASLNADVDLGAIRSYLALRYTPGPGTLLSGVEKLPPGHELTWCEGDVSVRRWWSPPAPSEVDSQLTLAGAAERLGAALRKSVHRHMIADVPVGAFLSGGIDSNIIVALMAEAASGPVKTFSIGFPDFPDDDRNLAAMTAGLLHTDHHPIDCRAEDMAMLPDIAFKLDEPVGDAIVVPMSVLAREARQHVKVVLSGEGADEILGGYMFHRKLKQIAAVKSCLPAPAFHVAAGLAKALPVALLERLFDYPGALGDEGKRKIVELIRRMGDAPLAGARVDSLTAAIEGQRKSVSESNEAEVQLRALEREAKTQRDQLEQYMTRYRDAVARDAQNSTPADARIISRAIEPVTPSFPKKLPTILVATLATLFLSLAIVASRALLLGRALSSDEYPEARARRAAGPVDPDAPAGGGLHDDFSEDDAAAFMAEDADAPIAPAGRSRAQERVAGLLTHNGRASQMDFHPDDAEAFREGLADWLGERRHDRAPCLLAVDAAGARGLTARDIARELAAGERAILIDLTDASPIYAAGLSELVSGEATFRDVIDREPKSRLHVITAGHAGAEPVLAAPELVGLSIQALAETYDRVILAVSATQESALLAELAAKTDGTLVIGGNVGNGHAVEVAYRLADAGLSPVAVVSGQPRLRSGQASRRDPAMSDL